MRPTRYLGTSRGKGWSRVDRVLAEGLEHYESSLNRLGIPSWVARDPDRRFVVDEIVDQSLAVLEEAQAEASGGDTPQHGLLLAVVEQAGGED